jgi:hypothetical protein
MFSRKKITLRRLNGLLALSAVVSLSSSVMPSFGGPTTEAATPKVPAKKEAAKDDKKAETTPAKPPDSVLESAQPVTADELVSKPHDFLGKNVKFTANFYAFSNLALDYKPALRSSKTHLSLLVLKPGTHIPLSELKLAMMIPKDKDPETELLAKLKDGDQVEIVGKQFSAALDDPWIEVYRLKKIGGSKDEDKDKKVAADKTKSDKSEKSDKADDKSDDSKSTK